MSDASTIRAGHAEVELGANLSQLASGLKTGQQYVAAFAGQIAKIGASIAAAGAVVVAPGRIKFGCGGNGYELTDVVLKLPSASCGNPAAAGFASLRSSFSFAFSFACSIVIQVSDVVALH